MAAITAWPAFDGAAAGATLTFGDKAHDVWYRSTLAPVSRNVDPFLIAALLPAMKVADSLRCRGTVSPRLLEGLPKIGEIFTKWDSGLRTVRLPVPDQLQPTARSAEGV